MENEKIYRDDLPPIPDRMKKLPVERGYPVPWFVQFIDGHYDFRIVDQRKYAPAYYQKLCWLCGEKLGSALAFVIGPMCAVNRAIGEPPAHRECAEFSLKACPFLNQSQTRRNEAGVPEGTNFSEFGIKREPGVMALWMSKSYRVLHQTDKEVIFEIGSPDEVSWWRQGRAATRAEVLESIESGLPTLSELAEKDGAIGVQMLKERMAVVQKYLPQDTPVVRYFGSAARR